MISFPKKTIRDVPLDGEVVLVRADYNVPLSDDGSIKDDFRMTSSLPTLQALIERQCRVVVCAHLGRPTEPNQTDSLEKVAHHLAELLGRPVGFVDECVGDRVVQACKRLGAGEVLLLENLRFHKGEEADDDAFGAALIKDTGAAYFVQDGFGVVHRAHASTHAITNHAPAVAGLLIEKEYTSIVGATTTPERPLVAVLGGAKVSDKIGLIERFVESADTIIIGGAMANAFLKYHGRAIGRSLCEEGLEPVIDRIYAAVRHKTEAVDDFLVLPVDVAVADSLDPDARRTVVGIDEIRHDEYILDIGTETIGRAAAVISRAETAIWNGTLGLAERPQFARGSSGVAAAIAHHDGLTSVVGGGDTADFVLKWSDGHNRFSHISTGGGASLELMTGQPMPGIDALLDA